MQKSTAVIFKDGKREVMTFTGELAVQWKDAYLKWDEEEWVDIWGFNLNVEDVWIPDINVMNS